MKLKFDFVIQSLTLKPEVKVWLKSLKVEVLSESVKFEAQLSSLKFEAEVYSYSLKITLKKTFEVVVWSACVSGL